MGVLLYELASPFERNAGSFEAPAGGCRSVMTMLLSRPPDRPTARTTSTPSELTNPWWLIRLQFRCFSSLGSPAQLSARTSHGLKVHSRRLPWPAVSKQIKQSRSSGKMSLNCRQWTQVTIIIFLLAVAIALGGDEALGWVSTYSARPRQFGTYQHLLLHRLCTVSHRVPFRRSTSGRLHVL